MGTRLAATIVLVLGVALLAWVALRSDDSTPVSTSFDFVDEPAVEPAEPAEQPATELAGEAEQSATPAPAAAEPPEPAIEAPENFGPRRSLVDLDGWLNTDITSLDDLDGQVVMVEMWTFGCSNCKARIPYNQAYYDEFRDQGFRDRRRPRSRVQLRSRRREHQEALVDLGVTWPVALDTNKKNFRAWQSGTTSYWPRTYLIDQNGDIRYDHIGEGKYEELRDDDRLPARQSPAAVPADA